VQIEEGFENPDELIPVGLTFDTNIIRITNFKTITPLTQIGIVFRAINPGVIGQTVPLVITSYTDTFQNVIIDQESSSAFVTVRDFCK
jgi:hypothetical protein